MEKKENAEKSNPESPQSCPIRKKILHKRGNLHDVFSAFEEHQFFFLKKPARLCRVQQLNGPLC